MTTRVTYPTYRFYRQDKPGKFNFVKSVTNSGVFPVFNIGDKVQLVSCERENTFFLITDRIVHTETAFHIIAGDIDYYVRFCDDPTMIGS